MPRQCSVFMCRQVLVATDSRQLGGGVWLGGVSSVTLRAEQVCESGYRFDQQGVDPGLLVGGAAGAELGDRAAVLGLGGELADSCGDGRVDGGGRAAVRGAVS